jgi:flagellar FliL protein
MSEADSRPEDQPKDVDAVEPRRKPVLVVILLAAAGAGVGGLVVGPRLGADAKGDDEAVEAQHEAGEHDQALGKFFELENMIVNPADTRGERFLMVSVAFEVPDDETLNLLHEREIQVRDAVSAALGSRTLASLTESGAREMLKRDLTRAVDELAGEPAWMRVYLPRFVIQ